MSRNLKLTVAYDGFDFHGWQIQPGKPTVQAILGECIARVTGEKMLPQGSGRTDAGVHALAQVASFETESPIPPANLRVALNDILPPAIRVTSVEEVPRQFHARKSAKAKTYRYRIYRGNVCPPFLARYVYHHPYVLDEAAMQQAAGVVIGEHDFTSFAAVDPEKGKDDGEASNIRNIFSSSWQRQAEELIYTVRGNGFLHHMVRNLVGTFLLIGKGSLTADGVKQIIAAHNRSSAGATAPASGLYLVSVEY